MARGYKDHFGNAVSQMERTLKGNKTKDVIPELLPIDEQVKVQLANHQSYMEELRIKREKEKEEASKVTYSGVLDRQGWLKARAILKAKANGTWIDPEKEAKRQARAESSKKKEYVPKNVQILSAFYGIKDIKVIDITNKILVNEKVTNVLVGEDPCPRKKKNVYVKAIVDGIETETEFVEGKLIRF